MTTREKAIVSAYTGILMGTMDELCKYIEEILGRPVWTHELADEKVFAEIKAKSKPDFLAICEESNDEFEEIFQMMRVAHRVNPELRFQQIMSLAATNAGWTQDDLFYCPDNLIIKGLSSFIEEVRKNDD